MTIDTKTLERNVTNLTKRGKNYEIDLDKVAIDCIIHASENKGDFTYLNRLYIGLPSRLKAGFVIYVKDNTPARFVTKDNKRRFKLGKGDKVNAFNLNPVEFSLYQKDKIEQELSELTIADIDLDIQNFIKREIKKAEKSGNIKLVKYAEQKLSALAA